MQTGRFAPGFRLSMLDVVVLAVGMMATIGLATVVWWWGFVIAFVLEVIFLFCNVIRMSRPLELTWAGTFWRCPAPHRTRRQTRLAHDGVTHIRRDSCGRRPGNS